MMSENPISSAPPNRLIHEKSPYLQQHARNPVDWYPWGEEAFAKARAEGKPVFLSIGYSACHWCHVMAHESFEDAEVAALMNEVFISVKADREERPDIDKVYMTACQLLTGAGGWPLTVILTPEGLPFYAATYLPKSSMSGRMGMLELIPLVREIWSSRRNDALNAAEEIGKELKRIEQEAPAADISGISRRAYGELADAFDHDRGGFLPAPKFPMPWHLMFLLRYWKRFGEGQALGMVEKTLLHMQQGGIYDQIGFGFHRYSTDGQWLVPHFEKMLYDQAQLALVYLEAYQATGREIYGRTASDVLSYVVRDMTSPEGGFYTAEDADSEGREGKFYLWRYEEAADLLDREDRPWFLKFYHIEKDGNFRDEATGRRTGMNILHAAASAAEFAGTLGLPPAEFEKKLDAARQRLFSYRSRRVRPQKDDKILADWNGLMIAALSEGARVLRMDTYREKAKAAIDFVCRRLRDGSGRLLHCLRGDGLGIPANLDDYAFFIWGLIHYYQASFDTECLKLALSLQEDCTKYFLDAKSGGFFFTSHNGENTVFRKKEAYDGATPSGNALTAVNLIRLSRLTGRSDLEEDARRVVLAFSGTMARLPSACSCFMTALNLLEIDSREVVVVGAPGALDTDAMLRRLAGCYLPELAILYRPANEPSPEIARIAPFTEHMSAKADQATAYVCHGKTCLEPTTDKDEMIKRLVQ